jgi:hypothetical protein
MENLSIEKLKIEASDFCVKQSASNHTSLIGVTDGKAVGTYVEHLFQNLLKSKYIVEIGNSASGIDLPGKDILTDIKVTSITQPQSPCPFKSARQKIYGLGYNLLIFVYDKHDTKTSCELKFINCTFMQNERTADYTVTRRLIEMLKDEANKDDIIGFLQDKNIPGDDITYNDLADEILATPPKQGYLTISNALQWRLQYGRVITLKNHIGGITNFDWD